MEKPVEKPGLSPLQRLTTLERVIEAVIYPRLAMLSHEARVQSRIIQALLISNHLTQDEIDKIIDEEATRIERSMPGIKINRNIPKQGIILHTPGGIVHVNQGTEGSEDGHQRK